MREAFGRQTWLWTGVFAALLAVPCLHAQKLAETSTEVRFQLDLHVPDDAIKAFLPAGWTSNVATQGGAKDANLRAIFVDCLAINGPDGKPIGSGSNRYVYLVAPVKDPSGATAQLVLGGLTDDSANAPGPFGNFLLATTHKVKRTTSTEAGTTIDTQDWVFAAPTGEHIEMHIQYQRGVGNRGRRTETKYYSAKDPTILQDSQQEQVLDVLRNVTMNPPDHVMKFSFKASGGAYAKLFPVPARYLSWDNILWIDRSVMVP